MDSAAAVCNGGMLAIIFMPLEKVEELIDEFNEPQRLVLANDNAPDQIVLSGDLELLDKMAQLISDRQLGKTKKVLVAGPWHSPYMKSAREEFERWTEPLKFKRPLIPIVLNATSKPEEHTTTIKHLVTWQLTSPVYWRESMNYLRNAGINTLYEIGPGRILSGLARVNGFKKETRIFNINNLRGIELTRIPDHPVPSTEPA